MSNVIKVEKNGILFEGTMEQFKEAVAIGFFGETTKKPTTSGRGTSKRVVLTEAEREAKKAEKNAQHRKEQKAWFESLTETEQKEFIAKKNEQRAKRTYMQAITASKLNVQMAIDKMPKSKKDEKGRVSRETYVALFTKEMKAYGYDWSPKTK